MLPNIIMTIMEMIFGNLAFDRMNITVSLTNI